MSEQMTVIPAGNVTGDITSCKIENQIKSIERGGVMSFSQNTTYITYDVCNKSVISEYKLPEFTDFGVMLVLSIGIIIIVAALIGVFVKLTDY